MTDEEYFLKKLTVNDYEQAKALYMKLTEAGYQQFKAIGIIYCSAFRKGVNAERSRHGERYTRSQVDEMIQAESDRRVAQALENFKQNDITQQ